MTSYSVILFVHVAAVLILFAALSFEALMLVRLRGSLGVTEARQWLEIVPGLPVAAMGSLLVVVISGIYLAVQAGMGDSAWPKVTVMTLVLLFAPLGAITGRRMRAIRQMCAPGAESTSDLPDRLRDPFFKISLSVRIAVTLGIVFLMGAKPGLTTSIGIVGVSSLLGVLWGFLVPIGGEARSEGWKGA